MTAGSFRPKAAIGLIDLEVWFRLNLDIPRLRLIFCTSHNRSFAKQSIQ